MKIMKVGIVFAFVKLNFVPSDGSFVALGIRCIRYNEFNFISVMT